MILVTTIGKVGAQAARVLAQRNEPVRILSRHPEDATDLTGAGVEVVHGDLTDQASLDTALKDVQAVILVSPAIPAEELGVIHRAVAARVQHVVKITSESSLDSPIPRRRDQAQIEQGLIASGLGYTLLKNNAYMQNFFMLAPQIATTSRFGSAARDGRIGMIDTRDVAAVAAEIAASPVPHRDRTYWLAGPQRLSYADAATILTGVLGRTITYEPLTYEQQKTELIRAGVPENLAAMNAQALELFAHGDSDWITDDVTTVTGNPPGNFQRFVVDYAHLFNTATAAA